MRHNVKYLITDVMCAGSFFFVNKYQQLFSFCFLYLSETLEIILDTADSDVIVYKQFMVYQRQNKHF
jgi:hypothetical protein